MGKIAGEGCKVLIPASDRKQVQEIERSIITKYRRKIWRKFLAAINEFKLVEEGDKVAVAVSGGKDSTLMAKLFQEFYNHGKTKFEMEFIAMDPGYHPDIKELLIQNCRDLNIPIHLFDTKIFPITEHIAQDYPCYMCAKMRRGALYSKAQELGCNKLALGHHFNDVIETILLNLFYAGSFKTMLPKLKSANFHGLELIRPLYYVEEKDIENFTSEHGIWPLNCACMVAAEKTANKRCKIKEIVQKMKKTIPGVDHSILQASRNVNMDCILGWRKGGQKFSYLDFYDKE